MSRKSEPRDPELERLLGAFREIHPRPSEKASWRAAVRAELDAARPAPTASPAVGTPRRWPRLVLRIAVPVGMAASLGFVIGTFLAERRYNEGQAMLFSQTEPPAPRPPLTTDESREMVRIVLE